MQSLMKVRVATWCKSKRNESTVVVKLFQDDVNINLHLMVTSFVKINKHVLNNVLTFIGFVKFI